MNWIKVSDRLPEYHGDTLIYDAEYNEVTSDYFNPDLDIWSMGENVTHWMPLPPAPGDEE